MMWRRFLNGFLHGAWLGTLVLGLGGRLLMRLIALRSGMEGGFSLGGSVEVLLAGGLLGMAGGGFMGLAGYQVKGRKPLPGIVMGLLLYLLVLVLPLPGKSAANGFPELQTLIYSGFGVLFLLFGLTHSLTWK